ncbi:hypothetical protein [Azospirillum sp. ST 5-10]|uniref:hypothetical protein n=1 Tax=unclassified Azospirillum TaxID=2630922 RepID=UPI003F4A72F9
MTDLQRPADRATAFSNARALCYDIDSEKLYPAFDAAMDMACRLNDVLAAVRSSGGAGSPATERHDARGLAR